MAPGKGGSNDFNELIGMGNSAAKKSGEVISNAGNVLGFAKMDMLEAKSQMMKIAGFATESCTDIIPLLKLEIFRDFSQIISLVFANAIFSLEGTMYAAKKWLGGLFSSIALDLGEAFRSENAVKIAVAVGLMLIILVLSSFFWMAFYSNIGAMKMNSARTGHETIAFAENAAKQAKTVMVANATILVALSVYLPVTQFAFQIFFCDRSAFIIAYLLGNDVCDAQVNKNYALMLGSGIVILVTFTLGLPYFLYGQINHYKPKGSPLNPEFTNDVDGERVPFDDVIYNEVVETDPDQLNNPFRSLYRGFERHHSAWKIWVMMFKLCLAFFLTWLSSRPTPDKTAIAVVTFLFMLLLFVYTYYVSPFVDPMNDFMDACGRFTAIVTSLAALIAVNAQEGGPVANFLGIIVLIFGVLNMGVMFLLCMAEYDWFRGCYHNCLGTFTWYDSTKNLHNLSAENVISTWQLDREVKHRVWQTFWNGVLLSNCGQETISRMSELKADAINYGIDYIRAHWDASEEEMQLRKTLRDEFEGTDLFWDDPVGTRDGVLDSETCFGKMYVMPYPFHIVVVYDDCLDESFINDPVKLKAFVAKNRTETVVNARRVRKEIRVLASKVQALKMAGAEFLVDYPCVRDELREVPDGTKTTGSGKNSHTTIVYSTITLPVHYTKCHIQLLVNQNISHSAGFKLLITYKDGHGTATKPRTNLTYSENNVTGEFDETHAGVEPKTFKVLTGEGKATRAAFLAAIKDFIDLDKEVAAYDEEDRLYRARLEAKFQAKRHILANQFWFRVYNNPKIPRAQLEMYLRESETNDFLRKFPDEHKDALEYLYSRVEFIDKNDASRLWYCFWDDFWSQNKSLGIVKSKAHLFDVSQSTALCYRTGDRKALEQWLSDAGVMGGGCSYKQLITPAVLDLLFDRAENPSNYPLKEYLTPSQQKMQQLTGKAAFQSKLSTYRSKADIPAYSAFPHAVDSPPPANALSVISLSPLMPGARDKDAALAHMEKL